MTNRDPLIAGIASGVAMWLLLFVLSCIAGSLDQSYVRPPNVNECAIKTRWTYIFPGYRLGCWMSERVK